MTAQKPSYLRMLTLAAEYRLDVDRFTVRPDHSFEAVLHTGERKTGPLPARPAAPYATLLDVVDTILGEEPRNLTNRAAKRDATWKTARTRLFNMKVVDTQ